jgi:hypothetical protein
LRLPRLSSPCPEDHVANVRRVHFYTFLDEAPVERVDVYFFFGGDTLLHDPREHRADDGRDGVMRIRSLHDRLGAHPLYSKACPREHGLEQDLSMFSNQSRYQNRDVSAAAAGVEHAHTSAYASIDQKSLRHGADNVRHSSLHFSHAER